MPSAPVRCPCGEPGPIHARGLCQACYNRYYTSVIIGREEYNLQQKRRRLKMSDEALARKKAYEAVYNAANRERINAYKRDFDRRRRARKQEHVLPAAPTGPRPEVVSLVKPKGFMPVV